VTGTIVPNEQAAGPEAGEIAHSGTIVPKRVTFGRGLAMMHGIGKIVPIEVATWMRQPWVGRCGLGAATSG
jgi:hypothetical protein